MIVSINNVAFQNTIFFVLSACLLLVFLRNRKDSSALSVDSTNELKGLAILSIILAHISFCLVSDYLFLWPLSNWAGVGVDLFFFLSGFGLTISAFKKDLSIKQFYLKRLSKVIIPVWVFLFIFLILDKLVLGISYQSNVILKSFLGFFSTADIYKDINSPLWFITPLLFYYLLFPIFFKRKFAEISALVLLLVAYLFLKLDLPISSRVRELYSLHYIGFPFGVFFASLFWRIKSWGKFLLVKKWFIEKKIISLVSKYILLFLLGVLVYLLYQHVGSFKDELKEQWISLTILLLIIFIFILKPVENRFFVWFGVYSFEIYLLHWVIMYRYDFVYRFLPAGVATFVYLILFLIMAYLISKINNLKIWKLWKKEVPTK